MNEISETLSKFKFNHVEDAIDSSIDILDGQKKRILGNLVPVGNWILERESLITKIVTWRNDNLSRYFSQFPANSDNARGYLLEKLHTNSASILFMVMDTEHRYIGHVAVENIRDSEAEIGNLFLVHENKSEVTYENVLKSIDSWLRTISKTNSIYIWLLENNPVLDYFQETFECVRRETRLLSKRNLATGFQLLLSDYIDLRISTKAVRLEILLPIK